MSLFPTTQRNKHLIEFNAGKVTREGSTLKPDTRKGILYMDQSEDQLLHLYWKERKTGVDPEEDFIIFPDEAELVRVNECTTGRVYLLKFKSSKQKEFFWMQNKNDEKDEELVHRVNQLINDPQSAVHGSNSRDGDLEYEGNAHSDLMQILGGSQGDLDINMTQDNLLQLIQNAGGLGSSLSSALPSGRRGNVISSAKWIEVKSKLAEINAPEQAASLELGDALNEETINTILHDFEIRSALFPFVNEVEERSKEEVDQLVQSQQFQQRLQVIHAALERDALTFITEALDCSKDIKSFLKAVYDQAKLKEHAELDAMDED